MNPLGTLAPWRRPGAAHQRQHFAGPHIGPVPLEFLFFACVLAGVALFHHYTLRIALGRW
jgi:hypothetical protein